MDNLISILHLPRNLIVKFLQPCRSSSAEVAGPRCQFQQLPLELIFKILELLPIESAAACSMTCRHMFDTFGIHYLQPLLRKRRDDRYNILLLLARDLPDHIACFRCKCLHHITPRESSDYTSPLPLGCRPIFENYGGALGDESYSISTLFRMAMNRHRQGRDCTKLLYLLSPRGLNFFSSDRIQWRHFSAKIKGSNMLIRRQHVFTPVPTLASTFSSEPIWHLTICPHMEISQYNRDNMACSKTVAEWDLVRFTNPPAMGKNEGLMQCKFCGTEVRVDYKELNSGPFSMFCTIWQDLGKGESHLDPQWQYHVSPRPYEPPVKFTPESIYFAFEQGETFKFDSLLRPMEETGITNIVNALSSNDIHEIGKAIGAFFDGTPDSYYLGAKEPLELFNGDRKPKFKAVSDSIAGTDQLRRLLIRTRSSFSFE